MHLCRVPSDAPGFRTSIAHRRRSRLRAVAGLLVFSCWLGQAGPVAMLSAAPTDPAPANAAPAGPVSASRFSANSIPGNTAPGNTAPGDTEAPAGRLTGKVTTDTGAAAPNAIVTAYMVTTGLRLVAVTNELGAYEFPALGVGPYIVTAAQDDLRSRPHDTTIGASAHATVDLVLSLVTREEQVVVTAEQRPQALDAVAKAITVVSRDEIDARDEYSVAETLRHVPGVQINTNGGPGQLTQLRIRGLRPNAAGILIDGLRFRDSTTLAGDVTSFLGHLNVINPDRVEVLRGSASSLYGTNAVGGVVNLVSPQGGGPTTGDIQIEAGQLGLFRLRGGMQGSMAGQRVRYSAGGLQLNVIDGVDGHDATRSTGGQGLVSVQFSPSTTLMGRVFASDDDVDLNVSPSTSGIPAGNLGTGPTLPARALPPEQVARLLAGQSVDYGDATYVPGIDDPDFRRTSWFTSAALVFAHQASERVNLRASYQRLDTNRQYRNGPQGGGFQPLSPDFSNYRGSINTADVRAFAQMGAVLVSGGYEFERESYGDHQDNQLPGPNRVDVGTDVHQDAHALFAQGAWQGANDRLHLAASARAQIFRLARPVFRTSGVPSAYETADLSSPPTAVTGDVSATYWVLPGRTKLRFHVGNAYRAPALYERFGGGFSADPASGAVGFTPYGDPLLEPDRYVSVDGGVDQSFWRDRVQVHATYFHHAIDSMVEFDFSGGVNPDTDPYGRFFGYINGGGGSSKGLELSADIRPDAAFSVTTSYTFTDSTLDGDVVVTGFFRDLGVARHTFSILARQRVTDRLDVHADLYTSSGIYGALFTNEGSRAFLYPSFARLDAGARYALPWHGRQLRIYGKVDNILDRRYYEVGWLTPGATLTAGVQIVY